MTDALQVRMFRADVPVDDALRRLRSVLDSHYIGEGPVVAEFEDALRTFLVQPHVVAVNAGTSALWLAYHLAANRDPGTWRARGFRVIAPPLTCLATTMPIELMGGQVLWGDVEPTTGNLDPQSVVALFEECKARKEHLPCAVVAVDWGGEPCRLAELLAICRRYDAVLIQDAAHSFGAFYQGRRVGTVADFTAFSFQAIKTLTTGDGGALCTARYGDIERARHLRWFGLDRRTSEAMRCLQLVREPGYKFHLTDLAAAIGLAGLPQVDKRIDQRRAFAAKYDAAFAGCPTIAPCARSAGSAQWLYTIRVPDQAAFTATMRKQGIEVGQVHARNDRQVVFGQPSWAPPCPQMDALEREMVCLPIGHWLADWQIELVGREAIAAAQPRQE